MQVPIPSISEDIQRNIYVDNIISGCDTEAQLVEYYTQARNIMKQANFNLRSWASNSISLQRIAAADKTIDHNTTVQIIGLLWNTCTDTMSLAPKSLPSSNIVSKRMQCSPRFITNIRPPRMGHASFYPCQSFATRNLAAEAIMGHST